MFNLDDFKHHMSQSYIIYYSIQIYKSYDKCTSFQHNDPNLQQFKEMLPSKNHPFLEAFY